MNRSITMLGLVLALFATACAGSGVQSPPTMSIAYDVHIGTNVQPTQVDAFLGALNDWTVAAGPSFRVTVTDEACPDQSTAMGAETCFALSSETVDCSGVPDAVGCAEFEHGQVVISIDAFLSSSLDPHVLRHEIGHALGLQHVLDTASLMYPSLTGSPDVTATDVAQYRALRDGDQKP